MKKKVYTGATLNVVLQNDTEVSSDNCPKGIISKDENGEFRFEEEIRKGRPARNPKLHDGKYLSMVRMQNGKYQFHMKTLQADPDTDVNEVAREVAKEIRQGFKIINA